MATGTEQLLRYIHCLFGHPGANPASDAALLERFAHQHDESAFNALIARHGPMVLGVCRRVLYDLQAAEDAFQATFLVLARKASTLRRPETLAAWLHGTARRLALKRRQTDERRRQRETRRQEELLPHHPADPLDEVTAREMLRDGDVLAATWLAHWSDTDGRTWKGQLVEITNPCESGWNFQRAATWEKAVYHRKGNLAPGTVRPSRND